LKIIYVEIYIYIYIFISVKYLFPFIFYLSGGKTYQPALVVWFNFRLRQFSSRPLFLPPSSISHGKGLESSIHLFLLLRKKDVCIDISVNCIWVATRWQQYSTHLHTNNTQINTINLGSVWGLPRLCELYPGICRITEEKSVAKKTLKCMSRAVRHWLENLCKSSLISISVIIICRWLVWNCAIMHTCFLHLHSHRQQRHVCN